MKLDSDLDPEYNACGSEICLLLYCAFVKEYFLVNKIILNTAATWHSIRLISFAMESKILKRAATRRSSSVSIFLPPEVVGVGN